MAMYIQSLPPEMQAQLETLRELDPMQYEKQIKQMMLGGGEIGVPGVPAVIDGGQQQI